MCRHIYDWNVVNCDVKQPIQQQQQLLFQSACTSMCRHIVKYRWLWHKATNLPPPFLMAMNKYFRIVHKWYVLSANTPLGFTFSTWLVKEIFRFSLPMTQWQEYLWYNKDVKRLQTFVRTKLYNESIASINRINVKFDKTYNNGINRAGSLCNCVDLYNLTLYREWIENWQSQEWPRQGFVTMIVTGLVMTLNFNPWSQNV